MLEDVNDKPIFLPRKAEFTDTYEVLSVDENWITIFFGLNQGIGTPAFIINIAQDRFQKMIESPTFDEGQETLVIDRNGVIISNADPALINQNAMGRGNEADAVYRTILDSGLLSGFFSYKKGTADYLVTYKKSPTLGWVFIGLGNKSELLANFNNIQTIMTVISALFMLASLVVSFFVSKHMYSPLYHLMRTVQEINNQKDIDLSMEVYHELQNEYLELVRNIRELKSGIDRFSEMKAKVVASSEAKKSEWVKTAADYVDKNFPNYNLTIEMIAEHIGLSPNYLRSIFKTARGTSLSKYLTDTRLACVKRMLLETDMHVHEIAEKAGFVNTKHFYVLFKQAAGITAEMFRKNGRGG
jgi:YesN/AraC family two-component response regulator